MGVGTLVLDSYLRHYITQDAESDLTHSAELVINMVKTAAAVSVKNHLRATAVDNREIVRSYHQQFVSGRMSEEEAKAAAAEVLLSQRVGKTGYLFVWDIGNAPESIPLAVHPKIQGQDVAAVDFVQKGARLKNGFIEYRWRNPGEDVERDKAMYLAFFEPWQWVISASSYKEEFLELVNVGDFHNDILSIRVGLTGYFFVIDSSGNIVIHPALEGNYIDARDSHGRSFIREICSMKRGQLSYSWKNPGEASYRQKLASFGYIPEYDWIVAASGYLDEFEAPLQGIRGIVLLITGMSVLLILVISFGLGFLINRPMQRLVDAFEQDARDLGIRLPVRSTDEIGRLTLRFNRFMDRLERESAERSVAEGALRESEAGLAKAQQIAKLGSWKKDWGNDAVAWSEEMYRLTEFDPSGGVPDPGEFLEWVHPEDRRAFLDAEEEIVRSGEPVVLEIRSNPDRGTVRHFLTNVEPLHDMEHQIVGLLGTLQDITGLKDLEEEREGLLAQLLQAQKIEAVGRLAGGVAHDFNNMLSVILGHTELALLTLDSGKSTHRSLQEILKAAQRSADLIRQLLAFARKQTISPKTIDINETVGSMLNMVQRLIGEDIELHWNAGGDLWSVKMDPIQIDQILANLCVNARDAIAGVGRVDISTGNAEFDEAFCRANPWALPGEYVFLAVRDDGCGMDKRVLDNLFEPFFTTKEVGKGTGLGLATVYGIVKQNQGFVNVSSDPGRGTTFHVYLPRSKVFLSEAPYLQEQDRNLKGTETILLVEDEESILELNRTVLELQGYVVLAASKPLDALDLAKDHPGGIDLLITDVIMPGLNGKELFERLSTIKPGFRSLFVSGYTSDVIAQRGVLDEGVNFLQKPFSAKNLAEKVREVLDC
jgi:signal transduction histidine kinase/CheY-like chemotaxis protein/HAMP domain-containing protein